MSKYLRGRAVAELLDDLHFEGIEIDDHDLVMLNGYAQGNISVNDLLAHICQFSSFSAYQEWLGMNFKKHVIDPDADFSIELIVVEIGAFIRRKNLELKNVAK